jgi:hypothetical protein
MPKICKCGSCSNPVFGGDYCKYHQCYRMDKPPKQKKTAKIKPVSEKRKEENKQYSSLRTAFLKEHPLCEAKLDNCTRIATDVHHKKGRTGRQNCPFAA